MKKTIKIVGETNIYRKVSVSLKDQISNRLKVQAYLYLSFYTLRRSHYTTTSTLSHER